MRIIEVTKLETCIDGTLMFKYAFDTQWTREAIQLLGKLGQLKVYDSFPRQMFQLTCPSCIVKGVQGNDECRVIYYSDNASTDREMFEKDLANIISLI